MALGAWEVQTAVYNRLASDSTLAALATGGVFDDVPQYTAFPYVRVGEETATDNGGKDFQACDRTIGVDVFSRYPGSKETKQMMAAVYDLLHEQALTVSGQQVVVLRMSFSSPIILEADGLTRHGVLRFRVLTFASSTYTAGVWLTEDGQEWMA